MADSHPITTNPPTATRRRMFAAGAGVATVGFLLKTLPAETPIGAVPALASMHPDAAVFAASERVHAAEAVVVASDATQGESDAEVAAISNRWDDAADTLADLQPLTMEGLRAKAEAALVVLRREVKKFNDESIEDHAQIHEWMALKVVEDLLRLIPA